MKPSVWWPAEHAQSTGVNNASPATQKRRTQFPLYRSPAGKLRRLSERNLVVEVGPLEAAPAFARAGHGRTLRAVAAALTAAIHHRQLAAELLQHNFGAVFLRAILVR